MTLATQIDTDVSAVFLQTDDFAERVIHYPNGREDQAVRVTALVTWTPEQQEFSRGRANLRRGELLLDSTGLTVTVKDGWRIDSWRYDTESVSTDQYGAVTVKIVGYLPETKGGTPLRTGEF